MLTAQELKLIQFILSKNKTHYQEIADYLQISPRTVAKYLDETTAALSRTKVHLVRKPNDGIYFTGDISYLHRLIQENSFQPTFSADERSLYLLAKLFLTNYPFTLQQAADELYVSRSTLEKDLRQVKQDLGTNDLQLSKNQQGIYLELDEVKRRNLLAQLLITSLKNQQLTNQSDYKWNLTLNLPPILNKLFSNQLIDQILNGLSKFIDKNQIEFSDYEFESLTIYLVVMFARIQQNGQLQQLPQIAEKQNFFCDEISKSLINILEEETRISLKSFEKKYLIFYVLAAFQNLDIHQAADNIRPQSIHLIVEGFIKQYLSNADQALIQGLSVHLEAAISRLQAGLLIYNPYTNKIKRELPLAFDIAADFSQKIAQLFKIDFNSAETAFIALHFESFFEREAGTRKKKFQVTVVCSNGIGTSQLLRERIKRIFGEVIEVTQVIPLKTFLQKQSLKSDFIISTINLNNSQLPVVVVNPLLDNYAITAIQSQIDSQLANQERKSIFFQLLSPRLISIIQDSQSYEETLSLIIDHLFQNKVIADKKIAFQAALNREKLASTADEEIALPHIKPELIRMPAIYVAICPNYVEWSNQQKVKIIFFMALNQQVFGQLAKIYQTLDNILGNKVFLKKLVHTNTPQEVYQRLINFKS